MAKSFKVTANQKTLEGRIVKGMSVIVSTSGGQPTVKQIVEAFVAQYRVDTKGRTPATNHFDTEEM